MITSFDGEYSFLSNFAECEVIYESEFYPTVEHAYVAAKTSDLELRKVIQALEYPGQAKRFGRKLKLIDNFDLRKTNIMLGLLRQKFYQPKFRELLLNTGTETIIEGNTWNDQFWGATYDINSDKWVGKNMLGMYITSIRLELIIEEMLD